MCLGTLPTGRKLLQATLQLTSKVGDFFLAIMGNSYKQKQYFPDMYTFLSA